MASDPRLPSLYRPKSVAELLTADTISKLLLGFTAGLDWLATAMQERGGERHDLWGTSEKYWCPFCTHFRRELKGEPVCVAWYTKVAQILLGEMAEEYPGQKKEFEGVLCCHAGMLDFAEVIRLAGRPFAVLHGGQLVPREDAAWAQSVRDRLAKTKIELTSEQIDHLIKLALNDKNSVVTAGQLDKRVRLFRQFAREIEVLLDKLYRERRHATEEALLHELAARMMALDAPTLDALWEFLTRLFVELRNATGLTHVEWFMGSEQERFHLTARTSATPEWKGRTLPVGPFWDELRHISGGTTGKRWDTKMRVELGLVEDTACLIYPLTCVYGAPSRNIPAVLVLACKNSAAELLAALLPRLALEITRGVSTAISEIEKNRVIQAAAAQGALVGHDMKMPLQILVNVVPAVRGCITRLGVCDANLLAYLRKVEDAVKSAQEKATHLEQMPVREFVVQPRKKRLDLVAMLDGVVNLASGMGTARGVTVQWTHRPDKPVFCDIDARYMLVALHAVLDNAVKFSFAGKRVDVSLETVSEQRTVLSVSNLGVGIPPEKRIAIFEFGKRGDVADKKHVDRPGSGLGLPFAKRIIEAHQGTIDISSRATSQAPEMDDYLSHVVNATIRLPLGRSS